MRGARDDLATGPGAERERLRRRVAELPLAERFELLHRERVYATAESVSGEGSELEHTQSIRRELPLLLRRLRAESLLDAPCGDCNWISRVELGDVVYTGVDVVEEVIERNRSSYASRGFGFVVADITRDELPRADVVLCRDALIHFSDGDVWRALENFARSGGGWLLTTSFVERDNEGDILSGDFRALNLLRTPFELPAPAQEIDESCRLGEGAFRDKRLLLWPMSAIARRVAERR